MVKKKKKFFFEGWAEYFYAFSKKYSLSAYKMLSTMLVLGVKAVNIIDKKSDLTEFHSIKHNVQTL